MAKEITNVKIWLTSANTEFDTSTALAEYRVVDGDLSKRGRCVISGLNFDQEVSGLWTDTISEINTIESL